MGNAIYKYNTKSIQEDRKALISKLHKLFKQAGIPKMKDMTTSIRGYRPITQNGYYIDIYRGDRTCFHIGTTGSKEEEWANKIKEILNNEGVKYTGSVDYFTVDMEKQDNKDESILEKLEKSINEAEETDLVILMDEWLTKLGFEDVQSIGVYKFMRLGNYKHVITFDDQLNELTWEAFKDDKKVNGITYRLIVDKESIDKAFKDIGQNVEGME